jgi:hypothetical protein
LVLSGAELHAETVPPEVLPPKEYLPLVLPAFTAAAVVEQFQAAPTFWDSLSVKEVCTMAQASLPIFAEVPAELAANVVADISCI